MIQEICSRSRLASRRVAGLDTGTKNTLLEKISDTLLSPAVRERLKAENQKDLEFGKAKGLSSAMLDRLLLNDRRIDGMAQSLREVAALPDPVGVVRRMWTRPNGLRVGKRTIPLGVIAIIYESRPNVTVEAFSLCFKAGNATVLRGGSEAIHSNRALVEVIQGVLNEAGSGDACQLVPSTDREAIAELLKQEDTVDVVIPRGGEGLIRYVTENSRIPVIKHYKGVCHVFVDENADIAMALDIVENAKVSRPGVCNALETLLVHEKMAADLLPSLEERLSKSKVEIRGDRTTQQYITSARPATEEDYYAEFLDLILAVRVVSGLAAAVEHIEKYGSSHTEAIVTRDNARAQEFLDRVNSSVVLVNASTRFADGGQLGLGAEIGISTSKLHAYGPMGLESLVTEKFIVYGNGQVRP